MSKSAHNDSVRTESAMFIIEAIDGSSMFTARRVDGLGDRILIDLGDPHQVPTANMLKREIVAASSSPTELVIDEKLGGRPD